MHLVATGAAVSARTGSRMPLIASLGICGVFVAGYEYMIANPSKEEGGSQGEPTPWVLAKKGD